MFLYVDTHTYIRLMVKTMNDKFLGQINARGVSKSWYMSVCVLQRISWYGRNLLENFPEVPQSRS